MQLRSRKLGLIVGVLVLLCTVFAIAHYTTKKPNPNRSGTYVDSYSRETVSNPAGKAPDKYGTPNGRPVYLGFDKLFNYGLSLDQINNLELAFYRYSQAQPTHVTQISVDVDHINTQHDPRDPNSLFTILFNVQFDQKKIYQAKAQYAGLNDIRLYLIDPSSHNVIFDSQVITST